MQVIDSLWKPNITEQKFPGKMTDLVLADCYLPESPVTQGYFHKINAGTSAAGLTISLSNDGENKSRRNLTFISYDSACMSCSVSTGCTFKVSTLYEIRIMDKSLGRQFWTSVLLRTRRKRIQLHLPSLASFLRLPILIQWRTPVVKKKWNKIKKQERRKQKCEKVLRL